MCRGCEDVRGIIKGEKKGEDGLPCGTERCDEGGCRKRGRSGEKYRLDRESYGRGGYVEENNRYERGKGMEWKGKR